MKPNNYKQKIVDSLVFHRDPRREKKAWFDFSICLTINVNPNTMKQERVFSHEEDMTKAEIYVEPQDRMTSVLSCLIGYWNAVTLIYPLYVCPGK